MSTRSRPALLGTWLALASSIGLAPAAPAAPEGRFFLSWNAPHGARRAAQDLAASCDSTRRDTLYLCFDPGRDSTQLIAIDAELKLWPAAGDTLDRHWWFESRSNPAHLNADFNFGDAPGALAPWTAQGAGGVRTRSAKDSAVVRLVWAVSTRDFSIVHGGRTYAFARLIVPRPLQPEACRRPVCFELSYARLAFEVGSREIVRRGVRWVTWNRGGGDPCGNRARANPTTPWYPSSTKR